MKNFTAWNILRSVYYHRKDAVYQIVISALLAGIITGSLLTGESVRKSLREASAEKLGNTDILISSGLRYFDHSLAARFESHTGLKTAAIFETSGYCQNFATGATALNASLLVVGKDFFAFNSADTVTMEKGYAAVNRKLADFLRLRTGDEIIVKFRPVDPLPANAPFAPREDNSPSRVLKVARIIEPENAGNFSLGISQLEPMNIFMSLSEEMTNEKGLKPNRLLIQNTLKADPQSLLDTLAAIMELKDIGLSFRRSDVSHEPELISDRIFIDSALTDMVTAKIPEAKPAITYLANDISLKGKSTPYSFVTGIDFPGSTGMKADEIAISKWVADDIRASAGDTIMLTWFVQGFSGRLEEKSEEFRVLSVIENNDPLQDPSLMPDFPGISGRTTCSAWDAGIPLLLDRIREKDEEYWNIYRGTPKAYTSYRHGRSHWSNSFGTATAIRFPAEMEEAEIEQLLKGNINPEIVGFTVNDNRTKSRRAASGGTDFSSLFLGLSFFIIGACIILLSLSVSAYFDLRKNQVKTLTAIGYRKKRIRRILFTEAILLSFTGTLPGAGLGYIMNLIIVIALNSVWKGAVQTDTLIPAFSLMHLLYGVVAALLITSVIIYFRTGSYIRSFSSSNNAGQTHLPVRKNRILLAASLFIFLVSIATAFILRTISTQLFFISGVILFALLIIAFRTFYFKDNKNSNGRNRRLDRDYAGKYYFFNQWQALTPVIIIAAGIFAVIITSANRQVVTEKSYMNSGGTGGYLIYAESAIPVLYNLSDEEGIREFGLADDDLKGLEVVQASRLSGDDASCLNLNYVTTPTILGIDPSAFIRRESFSFVSSLKRFSGENPWNILGKPAGKNCIYSVADQTVLEWGLKLKTGDTLVVRAEDGQPLNIIIIGGLKSSIFQGNLIIHSDDMRRYFPSVPGSSVFLFDGNPENADNYREALSQRFYNYGFLTLDAGVKLATFMEVTNTYLNVFAILGILGLILGITGLGIILKRNFNNRKREFALMTAAGFSQKRIRGTILADQVLILSWGIITGTFSGLAATIPSLRSGGDIPWLILISMIILIVLTGVATLLLSVRNIKDEVLISALRRE